MKPIPSAELKANLGQIQDNMIKPIKMRHGRHIFLRFTDRDKALSWLKAMIETVATALQEKRGEDRFTVNIGFTHAGLQALGMSQDTLDSFPQAFREGMIARAAIIGDTGPNVPDKWDGDTGKAEVHAMTWLRTRTPEGLEEGIEVLREQIRKSGGVEIAYSQDTMAITNEDGIGSAGQHLGFRDTISQPAIEGSGEESMPGDGEKEDGKWRPIKAGEFVLGYEDEAGEAASVPDPDELRVNSSYLVYRKLYQDVAQFRRYTRQAAQAAYGSDDETAMNRIAAKMIGRWQSGAPLALAPDKDDPELANDPKRINDFTFEDDLDGARCPLGSHIRRSNPRASGLKRLTAVRRHRLLRRSVEYGTLLPEGMTEDDGQDRGLVALFVVADIERLFEFVQKEWIQSGEFIGLDPRERDPINGVNGDGSLMTVPGSMTSSMYDLPNSTITRGGAYLFVPSLKALQGISTGKY